MLPELPLWWAGTDDSHGFLVEAYERAASFLEARGGNVSAEDPFGLPPLFTVQAGVGIVAVKGPLIPGSAGFMRLFGVLGYADVQAAVHSAASAKGVKSIMLDIASGGGAVQGVDETSAFLADVGKVKPIVTYASGDMQSAALWLGSAGTRRFASRTSMVGSIGTMTVHMDRTKQLADAGMKPSVFRSGKWKALGLPVEPLTEAAAAEIQKTVDSLALIFESRMAENLKVPMKIVHDQMGQGRSFLGVEAQKVGLVHGIATAQEAFSVAKLLGSG